MARFSALGTRVTDKYLLYVFVYGFICGTLLAVLSWPSEYNKDCKEAQKTTRQYLADTYQIERGSKMLLYENMCRGKGTADGGISLSVIALLGEDKEARERLIKWLEKWKVHDLLKDCEEIMDILNCEHNEPTIQKIQYFLISVVTAVVLLFLGVIVGWDLRISCICGLVIGLLISRYIVVWLSAL